MKTHRIFLLVSFIITLTCTSLLSANTIKPPHKFVVVLDAGHGGKDPGRLTKKGYKESDIALKIVLAIGAELEKDPNIKVIYTRKSDVFVDLFERGKIANKAEADLFVSIHCNAHNSQAEGAETWVLGIHKNKTNFEVAKAENEVIYYEEDYEKKYSGFNPNSPEDVIGLTLAQEEYLDQSIQLATYIQKNLTNKLHRKDRGVKQAGFIVLHQTVMPSVLIETGFITNRAEGVFLNSKRGQQQLAKSIAQSIVTYKNSINQNVGEKIIAAKTNIEQKGNQLKSSDDSIIFKVQIAASSKKVATNSYNFKALNGISREKEGRLYKYYFGSEPDYSKARKFQEIAKTKGYTSSFIVAFKDGKRIPLSEALKTTAN